MSLIYPVVLTPDDNGTLLATCPDLPEVTSFGADTDEALAHAADAIEEALAARIAHREDIPLPSKGSRRAKRVSVPALTAAKALLYRAMRERAVSKSELGRRLGVHLPQIDRLLDVRHASRLSQIEAALSALGKELVVEVRDGPAKRRDAA